LYVREEWRSLGMEYLSSILPWASPQPKGGRLYLFLQILRAGFINTGS